MEDMMQALNEMKHKLYDLADAVSEVMAELSDIESKVKSNCNCKHKGECYKTLGEHGYTITNCKGLGD